MARWKIEPLGVKRVVTSAETHATALGKSVTDFGVDLQNCASAIGDSIVSKALSDFAGARTAELKGVGTRVSTAMTGTVTAVNAYVKGNLEMAANAQATAAQAPATVSKPATSHGPMGPR